MPSSSNLTKAERDAQWLARRASAQQNRSLRITTPLHDACREGNFEEAREYLRTVMSTDGVDGVRAMILARDDSGFNPLQLACDAAGESDTGDASLKLLLLSQLKELDMTPQVFQLGLHELLPQLGALYRHRRALNMQFWIATVPGSHVRTPDVDRCAQPV